MLYSVKINEALNSDSERMKHINRFNQTRNVIIACLITTGIGGFVFWQGNAGFARSVVQPATAATSAPNVVVFMIDDLEVDLLDQMILLGKMPHFKSQFVDGATNFINTFVNRSVCCTSRATFLTGKYAHNHGVWNVDGPDNQSPDRFGSYLAETNNAYLPTWLKAKNYKNMFIGKWHLGYKSSPHPDINNGDGIEITGYDLRPGAYRAITWGQGVSRPLVYQTKYIGDMAKEKITAASSPQFMYIAPNAVHTAVGVFDEKGVDSLNSLSNKNVVAMTEFRHYSDQIWNQHVITEANGSYEWWLRYGGTGIKPNYSLPFTSMGNQALSVIESKKIVGWNVFSTPSDNVQQLILQSGSNYYFYSRNVSAGVATQWQLQGGNEILSGTAVYLPLIGWAAVRYPDGNIRQQVVQGSPQLGFKSYARHRVGSGLFSAWVEDPYWGDIVGFYEPVGFNLSTYGVEPNIAKAQYKIALLTKDTKGNLKNYVSVPQPDFFQIKSIGNPIMLADADLDRFDEEAGVYAANYMQINHQPANEFSSDSIAGVTSDQMPLHPYFLMRAPAEGGWDPISPGQTYDWGGKYPAGSLRPNGNPHSTEFLPAFKPESFKKLSYNKPLSGVLPPWYQVSWPELGSVIWAATSNEKMLTRLTLDRMEQLMSIDKMVGDVVAHAQRINPNTLFIFTSDNGHFNGEHRLGNKYTAHEESIKVPLYIKVPGQTSAKKISQLVSNADMAPTILDYAGLGWQDKVDGRSLKPLLEAKTIPWRNALLIQHKRPFPDTPASATDWAYGLPAYRALRIIAGQLDELYVHYQDSKTPEYLERYNMKLDKLQMNNVATSVDQAYETAIAKFSECKFAQCRTSDMIDALLPTITVSPTPAGCSGSSSNCADIDLNSDGIINLADYHLLVSNFAAHTIYTFTKLVSALIN